MRSPVLHAEHDNTPRNSLHGDVIYSDVCRTRAAGQTFAGRGAPVLAEIRPSNPRSRVTASGIQLSVKGGTPTGRNGSSTDVQVRSPPGFYITDAEWQQTATNGTQQNNTASLGVPDM
jgi:hypothetical protein